MVEKERIKKNIELNMEKMITSQGKFYTGPIKKIERKRDVVQEEGLSLQFGTKSVNEAERIREQNSNNPVDAAPV